MTLASKVGLYSANAHILITASKGGDNARPQTGVYILTTASNRGVYYDNGLKGGLYSVNAQLQAGVYITTIPTGRGAYSDIGLK